ncbi:MAG: hypothetical protein ACPGXK_10575 [Phycisphaerae bacterium]
MDGPAPLFVVPLTIEGQDAGGAIVDTGGGFEVLLKDRFGLAVVDTAPVVAFAGPQNVDLTEPFQYVAGGLRTEADAGIVEPTICNCNGLGVRFLRKSGLTLVIDYATPSVYFVRRPPDADAYVPFQQGPTPLEDFDTAFVTVQIDAGGEPLTLRALLDTGASVTVLKRGIFPSLPGLDRLSIGISHPVFGEATASAGLFDTEGIPDLIIGNDVMRRWGDLWFFVFEPQGGWVGFTKQAVAPIDETLGIAAKGRASTTEVSHPLRLMQMGQK